MQYQNMQQVLQFKNQNAMTYKRMSVFKFFLVFAINFLFFYQSQAQTTTWTGALNTNWNVNANWTNGSPSAGFDVIIPSSGNPPILNTTEIIQSLTIQTGGVLDLTGAGNLTISTNFVNDGTIQQAGGTALALGGNFTNNGTYNALADLSEVRFEGTANQQILGTNSTTFQRLVLNKTAGDFIIETNTTIDEVLTIPANVRLVVRENIILDLNDNFIVNGSILFNAPANYVANSAIRLSGTKNATISGTGTIHFHHLYINKTGAIATISVDIRVYASFQIFAGTFDLPSNRTMYVRGNFHRHTGADWDAQVNSTVVFDGEIETQIRDGSMTFYNMTINKSAANPATSNATRVRLVQNINMTITGVLTLTRGRFVSRFNDRLLIIADGATTTAPHANSFVEGPVRKIGNSPFTFPIGKNGRVGRLTITPTVAGSTTDYFTAEYFGTPFGNSIIESPSILFDITNREYWRLEGIGTTTASVTLHWEDGNISGLNGPITTVDIAKLRVAQWNSVTTYWEDRGNSATSGSVATTGSVTSNTNLNDFDPANFWSIGSEEDNRDWGIVSWVGNVSSQWEDPDNWSPSVLPDNLTDVYIIGERPNQPIISLTTGDVQIKSLTLPLMVDPNNMASPPATLTIEAGLTLTVGTNTTDGIISNAGTILNSGTIINTNSFRNTDNGLVNNDGTITTTTQAGAFVNGFSANSTAIFVNSGTITGSGNRQFDNNANATFNNLASGLVVCQGAFRNRNNQGGGAVFNNDGELRLSRNLTNDRPLVGTGLIDFRGANASVISGNVPITTNLDINKTASSITLQMNMVVNDDVIVPANVTFQIDPNVVLTVKGDMTNNGTFTASNPSTLILDGNTNSILTGNFILHHLETNKSGIANVQIQGELMLNGNLTVLNNNFQINTTGILKIANNIINNSSILAQTGSTVEFESANNSDISGTGNTQFSNLIITKSASAQLNLSKLVRVSGALTLNTGIVFTSLTNLLVLEDDATSTGGNDNSFVDGPMRKVGNDNFVFPVGKSGKWARIGISDLANTSTTDYFTAEYFKNPYTLFGGNILAPMVDVSTIEYWNLDRGNTISGSGTTEAKITLYWQDGAFSGIDYTAAPDLVVAYGNGTAWESIGGDVTGTPTAGSVTSLTRQATFSPFTFGSLSSFHNPLPIELLNFEAKKIGTNEVKLTWTTLTELNSNHFEIQKSQDAIHFEAIGSVNASGNSNQLKSYQWIDDKPLQGANYYRLKMIDSDGAFKYSKIVFVENDGSVDFGIESIFPNPTSDALNVHLIIPANSVYQIAILDLQGRVIKSFQYAQTNQTVSKNLLNLRDLPRGMYILKMTNGQKVLTQKIIKQ